MRVHILYGLPGSGKTTWAKTQTHAHVIDCDNMRGGYTATKLGNAVRRVGRHINHVVVDGLFTSFEQVKEAVTEINVKNNVWYTLHAWEKDVDKCLKNDAQRKSHRQAALTIKKLGKNYSIPRIDKLNAIGIDQLVRHVVKNNSYIDWWEKHQLEHPWEIKNKDLLYLCSRPWITGGESWSYTGERWAVEPEPQPLSFEELDELLVKLAPNVTFLQYKQIERDCVSIEKGYDSDYYHSHYIAYYKCDLEKLETLLREFGYL